MSRQSEPVGNPVSLVVKIITSDSQEKLGDKKESRCFRSFPKDWIFCLNVFLFEFGVFAYQPQNHFSYTDSDYVVHVINSLMVSYKFNFSGVSLFR